MYRLEWIERRKLEAPAPTFADQAAKVSPVVWKLGWTSFLTDISSEMVNSVLPVYLVLHLHLSPLQYGTIDGVYNGLAVILVSLAAGMTADRSKRHKEVALAGYGFSAICKLLLLAAGGVWGWLIVITGLDRIGKGIRTAPRDAMISLNTPPHLMASAFAVHRALDAGGALLGPIVAFILLAQMPGAFDVLWVTSFLFAILGVAALWLYVPGPRRTCSPGLSRTNERSRDVRSQFYSPRRKSSRWRVADCFSPSEPLTTDSSISYCSKRGAQVQASCLCSTLRPRLFMRCSPSRLAFAPTGSDVARSF